MKNTVLPADTYVVINNTILTEQDRKIITMLYQPIIGSIASALFFSLWSQLEKSEIISDTFTHHQLMSNMKLRLEDIIEAREKLEGIGILKTFLKKGNVNNYVYQLFSPLPAYEFFNNPILDVSLSNNVGINEYNKLVEYFKIPVIKLEEYENVTCSFNETYESVTETNKEYTQIKKISKNNIEIQSSFNLNAILELIPDEMLNKRRITKEQKLFINKLAYIYNLTETALSEIIMNSINDKNLIDYDKLKENCRKYYSFENNGKLPNLIYKNQPEYLRKKISDTSNRSKIIYKFETTSPYDFLYEKNNNTKPSTNDLKILEFLLVEQQLNPGVVNVLVDYVLKINNNKLIKSFVLTISSQWVRNKIETVEDAMKIAEKEYKSKKTYEPKKQIKTIETKPDWFDKNIEENIVSEQEQLEFEARLKNMK